MIRLKRKAFITTSYVHFHQLIWCTSGSLIAMCLKKKPNRFKINFKILCFSLVSHLKILILLA